MSANEQNHQSTVQYLSAWFCEWWICGLGGGGVGVGYYVKGACMTLPRNN